MEGLRVKATEREDMIIIAMVEILAFKPIQTVVIGAMCLFPFLA